MGTLVGVMGDVSIPKEHWETYAAQMLTVLTPVSYTHLVSSGFKCRKNGIGA